MTDPATQCAPEITESSRWVVERIGLCPRCDHCTDPVPELGSVARAIAGVKQAILLAVLLGPCIDGDPTQETVDASVARAEELAAEFWADDKTREAMLRNAHQKLRNMYRDLCEALLARGYPS